MNQGWRFVVALRVGTALGPRIVITTTGDRGADAAVYERLIALEVRCSLPVTGIGFSPRHDTAEDLGHAAAVFDAIDAKVPKAYRRSDHPLLHHRDLECVRKCTLSARGSTPLDEARVSSNSQSRSDSSQGGSYEA